MELQSIFAFLIASVLLTIMPGPDNLFVLTESISKGVKKGVWIALGLSLGIIFHTTIVASGFSLVLKESPLVYNLIKYAGVLYLIYLAYGSYKENSTLKIDSNTKDNKSSLAYLKKGLLLNILNPKVTLFFLMFLPQFIPQESTNKTAYFFILGGIFMLQAFIIMSLFAVLSSFIRNYLIKKGNAKWIKNFKVSALLLIALYIIFN